MKIRSGFVSNSSSSSFIILGENNYNCPQIQLDEKDKQVLLSNFLLRDKAAENAEYIVIDRLTPEKIDNINKALENTEMPVYLTSMIGDWNDVYDKLSDENHSFEYMVSSQNCDDDVVFYKDDSDFSIRSIDYPSKNPDLDKLSYAQKEILLQLYTYFVNMNENCE